MGRLSYDEELENFIRAIEEEERADLFKREAALPLNGRSFDNLNEEEFLTYLHSRTTRYLQELYAGHVEIGSVIGMQCLFDLARRKRHLGPDKEDECRYDLGGLEKLRHKSGPKE